MKFLELSKSIQTEINPIYLVTGQDAFLIEKTISILKKKLVPEYENLNYSEFNLENFNMTSILNSANGLPFMADKKLVVVKEFAKLNKNDEELLKIYSENPNPSTCLVLVSDERALKKLANKHEIDCSSLGKYDLLKLVAKRANNQNRKITTDAASLLIEKCDNDALKVVNELTKLVHYTDEDPISKVAVEEIVTDSFEVGIFKLTNALAIKNSQKTLEIVGNMLTAKTQPSQIISAISSNFRRMFLSSISTDFSNDQISDKLGVKPYAILKAKESARKFSVKNLKRINELLEEVDYMLKSGAMSQTNCVYYLIFNILTI